MRTAERSGCLANSSLIRSTYGSSKLCRRAGVDVGLGLRHLILGLQLRALRVEQHQEVDLALAVLDLRHLRGPSRGLGLFDHAAQARNLAAVVDAGVLEVFQRAQHGLLIGRQRAGRVARGGHG